MATVIVASTPTLTTTPGWEQEAASFCEKILVEQEKENSKEENPGQESGNPKIEEKSRPKVEPITEWQRKQFEIWMEQNGSNMYPSRDEKEKLAGTLDASYPQITRLFANHRRRFLKKKSVTPQSEVKEGSIDRLIAIIKEPSIEKMDKFDNLVHDETSTSERSVSPILRVDDGASETDDSLAAICGAVADQIHDDIENKQKNMNPSEIQKKKRRPRKRKVSDREAKLEATVDEILSKITKEDLEAEKKLRRREVVFVLVHQLTRLKVLFFETG
ncbi:hypothetical protein FO519_005090 [Halicephalobus sp. NKZ332]|nr:hypothetical protein FO519_005090 [Halicephalobus sp. NKZ332]